MKRKPGVADSDHVRQIKRYVETSTYNPATDAFERRDDDGTLESFIGVEIVLDLFDDVNLEVTK